MAYAQVMQLYHVRKGAGDPLLLVHPLGATHAVWQPVIDLLAPERDVIAVDMPGFGASPPLDHDRPPTATALAAALAEFCAELGVTLPHVAGNSLGGWVALELGLSGATASTTAIAPAGLWPQPLIRKPSLAHRVARGLLPLVGPFASSDRGRRLLLSSAVAHPDRVPYIDSAHLVRAYATASGFVAVNHAMRAGTFTALDRIPGPVTLVWPAHDRLITRPRQLPPNVRSVVLPDAGHIPFWDAPDAVAEILLAATGG